MDVDGEPLKSESQLIIANIGKTVTAAQVMRMVDEGVLDRLDPITDHLPPKAVAAFESNRATVRDSVGDAQWPPGPARLRGTCRLGPDTCRAVGEPARPDPERWGDD